jgi:hypothetical protein
MNNQNPVHYKYTAKYKKLGKTTVIRVPIHIKDEITEIINLLEKLANDKGIKMSEESTEQMIKTLIDLINE